ncbi:MAG TPA: transglycosylase SLT domain-containing protein, partial [Gallionella sp.]|nr:transglycosylase SLT domain-containing protein [Gallionella sp.]
MADQDADFLAARDAFRAGNAARLESYAQRLKGSPLEVYVAYYQLKMNLERADPAVVKAYLARPEDTPMIDRMRGEWLKLLGSRKEWELFDSEYPRLINEDAELTCYALQSRRRSQNDVALREARDIWFSGKGLPESCATLFEAALSEGVISEADVRQRLRLTLESGNVSLAKQLAGRLSDAHAVPHAALDAAATDADRYLDRANLDKAGDKAGEGQRAVALFALQRLAKQSPDLAAERWDKISAHFTEAERRYFYGWLGYEGARKQNLRALQWFRLAGAEPLNEQQLAWRVRAALRAQDWAEVLASVNAMGQQQRRDAAWRYWQGRALQALGKPADAAKIFAALSTEYSFYGQLAGEELGTAAAAPSQLRYQPGNQDIASVAAMPGVQRTLALYRMDLRTEAQKEWNWAMRNLNDQELLSAAEIARRNEMYDRAIGAADKTVNLHDFNLRYLAPYRDALQAHIRENELDEAWVYGLMRQESRFVTKVSSDAGAAGLMQIMPATAKWVARQIGMKGYRKGL